MGRALARIFCCRGEPALTRQNADAGGGGGLPQGTQLQGTSGYRGESPLAGREPPASLNERPVDVPADPGSAQDVTETPVDVPADSGSPKDAAETPADVPAPSPEKSDGKKKKDKTKHRHKPPSRHSSDSDAGSVSSFDSDSDGVFAFGKKFWAFDNLGFKPEVYPPGSPLTEALSTIRRRIGGKLGGGYAANIYDVNRYPNFVVKIIRGDERRDINRAKDEVSCFNRFYGDGSAACTSMSGKTYILMRRVPGVPMGSFNVEERTALLPAYNLMIQTMFERGIITDDPHLNNAMYDANTGTANPVDMGQCVGSGEFGSTQDQINLLNQGQPVHVRIDPNPSHPAGADLRWVQVDKWGIEVGAAPAPTGSSSSA